MRVMFAVRPPPGVASVLTEVPRPAVNRVDWTVPERWIIKLRPLGHVGEELWPPLLEAVEAELDGAGPVEARLGPATRRYANQLLCLPVPELIPLAEAIFEVTAPIVPVTHPQPVYTDLVVASGKIPANLVDLDIGASWMVSRVLLIADRSSPRRVRLDDVGSIALTG
jgi:hypothetical protein